jgi:hypothetical protein
MLAPWFARPDGNTGLVFQHQRAATVKVACGEALVVFGSDGPTGVGLAVNCVRDGKFGWEKSASALANLTLRGLS